MKPANYSRFFSSSILRCLLIGSSIAYLLLCILPGHGVAFSDEQASPKRIIVFPLYAEEILVDLVGTDRIVYVRLCGNISSSIAEGRIPFCG